MRGGAAMSQGIGDCFQQDTKYSINGIPSGAMRGSQPEVYKSYPGAARVALPNPSIRPGANLWEILAARRSHRKFADKELPLEDLSLLLWSFNGITAQAGKYDFRTAPSAGALYPVETYLVVNNAAGVDAGAWHHNIPNWELELVRSGFQGANLSRACLNQRMCETASVVFVWTGVAHRCKWKYLERAYRYIYLDCGHAGAHLHLAAEALGLGCCMIGAFFDDEINAILGVDGEEETVLYIAAVGAKA